MLEQTQQSAPVAPAVVNTMDMYAAAGQSWKKGGDATDANFSAQADAQNQLNMAKYNNDYNYWLWQQQTQYNSPAAQVARLKAAGLNPNFNSIEGAGNASSPFPSQGKLNSNYLGAYQANISARAQKINEINSVVSAANDLVKNIGEGFDMYKTYISTPAGGESYRGFLRDLVGWQSKSAGYDAMTKDIVSHVLRLVATGNPSVNEDTSIWGENPYSNPLVRGMLGLKEADSLAGKSVQARIDSLVASKEYQDVMKSVKQFELGHILPEQEKLLQQQYENLLSRTGLLDLEAEWYSTLKGAGIATPFLIALLKALK